MNLLAQQYQTFTNIEIENHLPQSSNYTQLSPQPTVAASTTTEQWTDLPVPVHVYIYRACPYPQIQSYTPASTS